MSNVLQRAVEAYERGDLADAGALFEKTLGVARHNLGVIAAQADDEAEAIRRYREALVSDPGRADSAFELSLHLVRQGRYAEAWPLHEARRRMKRLGLVTPSATWPEWTGQDLAGKRLAVLGEQGFGDQIMFARFPSALRAMGAEVRLACAPEVATLLGGAPPSPAPSWTTGATYRPCRCGSAPPSRRCRRQPPCRWLGAAAAAQA